MQPRETTPASAPRDTEEGRALLQSRLAKLGRWGALLGLVFLVVGVINGIVVDLEGTFWAGLAQAGMVTASFFLWWFASRGQRSTAQLLVADVLSAWTVSAVFIAMGFGIPVWARPELVQLICVSNILGLRAFWIPSSALRTFVVSFVPALAVIVSTVVLHASYRIHPTAPSPVGFASVVAILAAVMVALTTSTSRTIFGLRERVREAMQLGQYTLLEKIGEGGMGIVYKARHATLKRPTAIKLLPPERAGEHNLVRFEREVQLTSMLTHPNTVAIYDYGRSYEGILYYAMEYLDGLDLESLVQLDGPQPASRVAHILLQACGALEEAHGAGLIHRDIKPQNIVLCQRGGSADVVKLLDFGLVKELTRGGAPALSMADAIVGTPLYMPPEAILNPAAIDARADLYALGAVAYFLLTGTPPFRGASVVEICGHHLHSAPESLAARARREVPAELEQVVLACLAKDPGARPASAAALAERVLACQLGTWSGADAKRWWHDHEPQVRNHHAARAPSSTELGQTLAVDLRARM